MTLEAKVTRKHMKIPAGPTLGLAAKVAARTVTLWLN